jgi:hypothetical protein
VLNIIIVTSCLAMHTITMYILSQRKQISQMWLGFPFYLFYRTLYNVPIFHEKKIYTKNSTIFSAKLKLNRTHNLSICTFLCITTIHITMFPAYNMIKQQQIIEILFRKINTSIQNMDGISLELQEVLKV